MFIRLQPTVVPNSEDDVVEEEEDDEGNIVERRSVVEPADRKPDSQPRVAAEDNVENNKQPVKPSPSTLPDTVGDNVVTVKLSPPPAVSK